MVKATAQAAEPEKKLNAPWTRSDLKTLENRWFSGDTVIAIAEAMHRPEAAVRKRLEYQGWW